MNKLQIFIKHLEDEQGGFLRDTDMPGLIELDRLFPVLVRCGGCRFTCGAQYLDHMIRCIEAGNDYVRDVSFPVGSMERAQGWQPECPVTAPSMIPASFTAVRESGERSTPVSPHFDEQDCSGAFDGHQVISDADSGL